MLTVEQALAAILENTKRSRAWQTPLDESLGMVLAEEIVSDMDSPPFDKSLMDGFAVRAEDVVDGKASLLLIEEVMAGQVPRHEVQSGQATQVMTGAPLPRGADAVVRVEDSSIEKASDGTRRVHLSTVPVSSGTNLIRQGTSMKMGERVLPQGRVLRPQELGALAELGRHQVSTYRRARVGVLATGDELVPIAEKPGPGQIRNSNGTMLCAQIRRAGAIPVSLGIARDERHDLGQHIKTGLKCDMLLLSGGVSAGKLDLVPAELAVAGVQQVFHKIRMKPGKPLWFGIHRRQEAAGSSENSSQCAVFGLPGNPVSSMVCFELFVRPAIRQFQGTQPAAPQPVAARLTVDHQSHGDRPTYYPAILTWTTTGPKVTPVRWQGSSDLRGTVEANATALFPPGEKSYLTGDMVDVIAWD